MVFVGKCGLIAASALAVAWAAPAGADVVSAMVDISSYQSVDTVIPQAKAAGVELLMHRATLGADRTDQSFQAAFRKIRSAKLSVGAYHVLVAQSGAGDVVHGGMNQAHQFLAAVGAACKTGEPVLLALDWETVGGASAPASAQTAAEFVTEVRSQTGADVLIYSDEHTLSTVRSSIGSVLSQSPLWLAAYHRAFRFDSDPYHFKLNSTDQALEISLERDREDGLTFPIADDYAPWTAMTFWQFSEGGDTGAGPKWDPIRLIEPSITAYDTSYFFGTRTEFEGFVAAKSWKCDTKVAKKWPALVMPVAPAAPEPVAPAIPAQPAPDPAAPLPSTSAPAPAPDPAPAPSPSGAGSR
jgi:GH25 family lysozyme M1 (1,4-beta-N-acetylmuramidase)